MGSSTELPGVGQKTEHAAELDVAFRPLRLPLDHLRVVGYVRRAGDDPELSFLAADIAVRGLLQPLVVRPAGDAFDVIAGHRRLAAVKMLRWTHVPCLAVHTAGTPSAFLATQLAENGHRRNLTPCEEAVALSELKAALQRENGRCTQADLAKVLNVRQPYVSERLSLRKLPSALWERLERGQLSLSAALAHLAKPSQKSEAAAAPLAAASEPQTTIEATEADLSFRFRATGVRLSAAAANGGKPTRAALVATVRRWLEVLEKQAAKS